MPLIYFIITCAMNVTKLFCCCFCGGGGGVINNYSSMHFLISLLIAQHAMITGNVYHDKKQ